MNTKGRVIITLRKTLNCPSNIVIKQQKEDNLLRNWKFFPTLGKSAYEGRKHTHTHVRTHTHTRTHTVLTQHPFRKVMKLLAHKSDYWASVTRTASYLQVNRVPVLPLGMLPVLHQHLHHYIMWDPYWFVVPDSWRIFSANRVRRRWKSLL